MNTGKRIEKYKTDTKKKSQEEKNERKEVYKEGVKTNKKPTAGTGGKM